MQASWIGWAKGGLVLLWLFAVASFFMAPSGARSFGQLVFWLMLIAHAFECVIFWRRLKETRKPMAGQIVQIVLFGVVHYQTLRKPATPA